MKSRFLLFFPVLIVGIVASVFFASTALAATYIVDTPTHPSLGGACNDGVRGDCSLQEAVAFANANPGADTIIFHLSGATLSITAPVLITEALTIDGYARTDLSKANSVPAPGLTNAVIPVMVDGGLLAGGENCIDIKTANRSEVVTIKGIAVGNCPQHGITITGDNKVIQGNYIGTDMTGLVAAPNGVNGIYMTDANLNLIGGPNPADRNVISGNSDSGILATNTCKGNRIEGNFIGLDATGTAALANGDMGILMGDYNIGTMGGNVIGNSSRDVGDGKRNYISGNAVDGVHISGAATNAYGNVQVRNNYIGTDVYGATAVPNGKSGVTMVVSDDVLVEKNLISGNMGLGVYGFADSRSGFYAYRLAVFNNKIGTDATGLNAIGNGMGGVSFVDGVNRSYIGDASVPGSGNLIAFNTGPGVMIVDTVSAGETTGNKIQTNSIHSNSGLGIDLGNDGVTPNDANDADTGPNHLQNYPIVESAIYAGGNTTINASLHSQPGRTNYRIEFFANDVADPTGYGEGQTYLGALTGINMDLFGDASFSFVTAGDFTGKFITATATDISDHTSEFGPMTSVDLSLTKTASVATADINDVVTFTVTVSTPFGLITAKSVQVTDLIGRGFTYLSHTSSVGAYDPVTGVWNVGDMGFLATETLTIDATVSSCGNLSNTASISGGPFDPVTADNTATAAVTVTCPPTPPIAGGRPPGVTSSDSKSPPSDDTAPSEDKNETTTHTQSEPADQSVGEPAPTEKTASDSKPKYCTDYVFSPANPSAVTRHEFIKLMLELTCHDIPTQIPDGEKSFTDYPRGSNYNEQTLTALTALYQAVDEGIISGYPDGTLKPFDPVNFAEASKIVYMSVNISGSSTKAF